MIKVLFVDDEKPILNVLTHLIPWNEIGINIIGKTTNVDTAMNIIQTSSPDILITDIRMPNKTGLNLIRTLRNQNNNIKCIVLSGYDDFNYIKEGLKYNIENYLLKPVDKTELLNTINQIVDKIELENNYSPIVHKNILKINILNRLIRGQISTIEFREKSIFVNKKLLSSALQVCTIKYNTENFSFENIITILKEKLLLLIPKNSFEIFCDFEGKIILILLVNFIDNVKYILDSLLNAIKLDLQISVGTEVSHYKNLNESYKNAQKAENYFIPNKTHNLVFYDDIIEENKYIISDFNIDYGEIENKIRNCEKVELQKYINNIFSKIIVLPQVNFEYIKLMTLEIFILFNRIYGNISYNISDTKIIPDYLIESIYTAPSLDYLHDKLITLTEKLDHFVEYPQSNYSTMINDVISYIHKHYSHDLSLKIVAEKMAYNSSYLGKKFRKEVGILFSEYVTGVKMEKAKYMIQNTNLKISDISKKVGITNTNYFYSLFKKYYKDTPTAFRNKHSNKNHRY